MKYITKNCYLCNKSIDITELNVSHLLKSDGNYYCVDCQQNRIITSANIYKLRDAIEDIKNSKNPRDLYDDEPFN